MLACVIRAARDMAVVEVPEAPLGPGEVRLQLGFGGICGSDLHYFQEGRVANSIVLDPMILGHEFNGRVLEVGAGVSRIAVGALVAVNPARPCGACRFCARGLTNLCTDMRFMGSAARRPHEPGGFAERPVVLESQCVPVPADTDLRLLALAEPYAVALHAVARAGDVAGAAVLVTGAGPIGTLCAIAARQAGAARIVVTDVVDGALRRAAALSGAEPVNVGWPGGAEAAIAACGTDVSVVMEASGAPAALSLAMAAVEPRGRIVQVGFLPPAATLNTAPLLIREIELVGAYRFAGEFDEAVRQILERKVDLSGALTGAFRFSNAHAAMEAAADKDNHLKVVMSFT